MSKYLYGLPFSYEVGINISHPSGDFAHENFLESKYAVDFLLDIETPIYAARAGKVIVVKDNSSWYGMDSNRANEVNLVAVDHGDGTGAEYVHLGKGGVTVKKDQIVKKGDLLGYTGYSGLMDVPHLHFNVFQFTSDNSGVSIPVEFAISFQKVNS